MKSTCRKTKAGAIPHTVNETCGLVEWYYILPEIYLVIYVKGEEQLQRHHRSPVLVFENLECYEKHGIHARGSPVTSSAEEEESSS